MSAQERRSKELPEEMRKRVATILASALMRRFRKGTSQAEMADRIGIKQPNLSLILSGKGSLGVHALIAIRNFCEVSIDELLGLPPLPRTGAAITADTHADPDGARMEAAVMAVLEKLRREKQGDPSPDDPDPTPPPNVYPLTPKKKGP